MDIKQLVIQACAAIGDDSFEVEFWDGDRHSFGPPPASFLIRIKSRELFNELFTKDPDLVFGEAYADGRIEIEGDIQRLVRVVQHQSLDAFRGFLGHNTDTRGFDDHSIEASKKQISHHYDLGNEFFAMWLGETMAYSCAYFKNVSDNLDTAQESKFEYICRKLQLAPGVSFLDIGCGWGGLLVHAARKYGVRGLGITLSEEQKAWTEERVQRAGLSEQVKVELADYRELPSSLRFDKISSVGMVEHVGKSQIGPYMKHTAQLLAEGGIGVIQTMGHLVEAKPYHWIKEHIFPGHYLPQLDELVLELGRAGLEVTDIENLRTHYGLTVDHWIKAYDAVADRLTQERGETFVRKWRFYLNSLAGGFKYGEMKLWQLTFSKGLDNALPLTRDYLYQPFRQIDLKGGNLDD